MRRIRKGGCRQKVLSTPSDGGRIGGGTEHLNLRQLPKGMEKGMVLIVQNAWPELAAYYPLASAIVTNEGGITSHGVVVAREYGIPCIVRTHVATEVFNTGDMVEVDAERGIVTILPKSVSSAKSRSISKKQ